MVEAPPRSSQPIFQEDVLVASPQEAKEMLYIYYAQASNQTFDLICRFGAPFMPLGRIAVDLATMVRDDARLHGEQFGTDKENPIFMNGIVVAKSQEIVDMVDTNKQGEVAHLFPRLINQLKKRFIYYYCDPLNVQAVCEAQGGIPQGTSEPVDFSYQVASGRVNYDNK